MNADRNGQTKLLIDQMNLLILRNTAEPNAAGFDAKLGDPDVFIFTKTFEGSPDFPPSFYNACAHELGHALSLSTELDTTDPKGLTPHDHLILPDQYGGFRSIMNRRAHNEAIWLRHEDWLMANSQAKIFANP
jgi:hypothetical protein